MKRLYLGRLNDNVRITGIDFKPGQTYPLAVEKHWWSKRVTVYQRHGWHEEVQPGTEHYFDNMDQALMAWSLTPDRPSL